MKLRVYEHVEIAAILHLARQGDRACADIAGALAEFNKYVERGEMKCCSCQRRLTLPAGALGLMRNSATGHLAGIGLCRRCAADGDATALRRRAYAGLARLVPELMPAHPASRA